MDVEASRWSSIVVALGLILTLTGCAQGRGADDVAPTAPVRGLVQDLTRCPESPASARATSLAGAREALLPFEPSRFLLCRYGGLNSGDSQLLVQQHAVTTRAAVAHLAAALRAGNPPWQESEGISCPADFAATTTVYAADGSRAGWLILRADRTGCPMIRNGYVNAHIGSALAAQLTHLVGAPGT